MSDNTPIIAQIGQQRGSVLVQNFPSFTAINSPKAGGNANGLKTRQSSIVFTIPLSGKQAQIRIESPRTQLAMKHLGILPQSLQYKSLEDFGGPNVSEKIKELRYEHYQDRLTSDYISILKQRKEIIKREREQSMKLNESITSNQNYIVKQGTSNYKEVQSQASTKANTAISGARTDKKKFFIQTTATPSILKDLSSANALKSASNNRQSKDNLNITSANNASHFKSFTQKNSQQYRSFSESRVNPMHMSLVFDKTIKYLRSTHESPDVQEGSCILNNGEETNNDFQDNDPFESQMQKEIDRFNRLKLQKQKEAKFVYQDDLKRQKMMEDMIEREKHITEFKIRQQIQKQQKKEKDREKAIEKLEQIRSFNSANEEEKFRQKQEMMKRLEDIKQKQLEQNALNEEIQEQKRRQRRERNEKISRAKSECQLRDFKESQKMYKQFLNKMMISDEQYKQKLAEKQQRTRERLSQEQQRLDNYNEEQKIKQKMNFSSFVEKLYSKDDKFKKNMEKKIRDDIQQQQLIKEKQDRLRENQQSVFKENHEKKIQLNQKFQKIEENRIKKQEDQQETFKLKQELRNLKLNYVHENFERKHRINDYKLEQMLDKERWHQSNIAAIKNQMDYVKKAKKEVYSQYRLEGDRINEGIKIIQDNLFPTQIVPVSQNHAKTGIKVLKKIFKQDEEEQKELEERYFPKKVVPVPQNNNTTGSQYILRDS